MQAIRTTYHGPTNTRGARIVAKCDTGQITTPYRYDLSVEENHRAACDKLREKLGWYTPYYGPMVGGYFNGAYYWVFAK